MRVNKVMNRERTRETDRRFLGMSLVLIGLAIVGIVAAATVTSPVRPRLEVRETEPAPVGGTLMEPAAGQTSSEALVRAQETLTDEQSDSFFEEYRLERERTRARQMELIAQVMNDPSADSEVRRKAQEALLDAIAVERREFEAESLIRARGYEDAIVFLSDGGASVVVKSGRLEEAGARQIGDAVARATGVALARITVVERGR
ncbi:MAG: SpoIIIAH-like family protein [Firmicutes bacterium]|nr:SpoIIIAH-like family protein [Bacillota bacterium]